MRSPSPSLLLPSSPPLHFISSPFLLFLIAILTLSCSNPTPEKPMTVMTLNVRYDNPADAPNDWKSRLPIIVNTIEENNPDVFGLQEVLKHQLDDMANSLPAYGHIGVGRDDGREKGEYSPIFFSKDKLKALDYGTFWLSPTPGDTASVGWDAALTRISTWVKFKTITQEGDDLSSEFYFLNTHFDHMGDTARMESAKLIMRFIHEKARDYPVVLTGDFNAGPGSAPYSVITSGFDQVPALLDAYVMSLNGEPDNTGTFNGFGSEKEDRRIDYIFTSPDWKIMDCNILKIQKDGIYISDHYPVIARIILKEN